MAEEALLRVSDLTLRFGGITALAGVGLEIREGETVAVIGPNGSGKTSLFNCITGLYKPTSVAIAFREQSRLALSPTPSPPPAPPRPFQYLRFVLHTTP